jgi:WD40 repeat protein
LVLTASADGSAKIWEAQEGKLISTLEGHSGWVSAAKFSPDGSKVLTASHDGTALLWSLFSEMDQDGNLKHEIPETEK